MKKINDWNHKHVVISRTDSIGDVMLTLPLCARLKEQFPDIRISFLGKDYTLEILANYPYIDQVLSYDYWLKLDDTKRLEMLKNLQIDAFVHVFPRKDIARWVKQAKIPYRIGTSHRLFHWTTCNVRLDFTRKNSPLHEAQLNFELLKPFGITRIPSLEELNHYTEKFGSKLRKNPPALPFELNKPYVILHPKSQGSAREWPIEKYIDLAQQLISRNYTCYFTGTEKEGLQFREYLPENPKIVDTTGKLSMEQLLELISHADALVACSTGPLHLAGFLQIKAIGLFITKRPMHPGRWQPLGKHASTFIFDENCPTCASKNPCNCIAEIPVERVLKRIEER